MGDWKRCPKWAQEEFRKMEQQRDITARQLNEYLDNKTESPFRSVDLVSTGEEAGPSYKTNYIQAHRMEVKHGGVHLDIILRDQRIDVSWGSDDGNSTKGSREVCMSPYSYQAIHLIAKENMR